MTPEQKEAFEERAAIMEYEAKLSRAEAERLARKDVLRGEQRNLFEKEN